VLANPQATTFREPRWLMPAIDAALALLAFALSYVIRYEVLPIVDVNRAPFLPYFPYAIAFMVWLVVASQGGGLYKMVRGRSWFEEITIIINSAISAVVVVMALTFVLQPLVFSRLMILVAPTLAIVLLGIAHAIRQYVYITLHTRGVGVQRVLVIGAGTAGQAVLRVLLARKDLGYQPIGYLDDDPERGNVDLGRLRGLGDLSKVEQVIRDEKVDVMMITLSWRYHDRIMALIATCQRANVEVRVVPDVFQLNLRQVQVDNLDGVPLLGINGNTPFQGTNRLYKRALDIVLIVLVLPLLIPLFAVVALLIRLETPGPIFYSARRVGENGREFKMYKFRSMIANADAQREELIKQNNLDPRHPKIKDDPRITRIGSLIRRTSIDELPNLLNVILGHMSLVGPRPPTPDEVLLYEEWHKQRLQIIPGMTGLWQVSGRSDVPFDEMCLLDIYYIENWSLKLDLQILMMTLPRVLMRQGAY
jgi:exopolysaccharide biosynthesis polyprenyl glycosylphosphotransferase